MKAEQSKMSRDNWTFKHFAKLTRVLLTYLPAFAFRMKEQKNWMKDVRINLENPTSSPGHLLPFHKRLHGQQIPLVSDAQIWTNFVWHKLMFCCGAPIVSLFYMLNICSICAEYSFYISNICSVFQMFVPYFKYLFYISNIYSQFEIFVQYSKNLCYISNICSVLK